MDVPYHADCEYDYYASDALQSELTVGSLVIVPFGAANRQKVAIVTSIGSDAEYETNKIKHISSVMSSCFSLDEKMMGLCRFMKSTTLCTIGDAVKCMVPTSLVSEVNEHLNVTDKLMSIKGLKPIYEYVAKHPDMTSFPTGRRI